MSAATYRIWGALFRWRYLQVSYYGFGYLNFYLSNFLSLRLAVMLMKDTFVRSEVVTWIVVGGVVLGPL